MAKRLYNRDGRVEISQWSTELRRLGLTPVCRFVFFFCFFVLVRSWKKFDDKLFLIFKVTSSDRDNFCRGAGYNFVLPHTTSGNHGNHSNEHLRENRRLTYMPPVYGFLPGQTRRMTTMTGIETTALQPVQPSTTTVCLPMVPRTPRSFQEAERGGGVHEDDRRLDKALRTRCWILQPI